MELRHIVVAIDDSDIGRGALGGAMALAAASGARLTALTVLPASAGTGVDREPRSNRALLGAVREDLARWVDTAGRGLAGEDAPPVEVRTAISSGVPSIEICRFAEEAGADLLVLGRKRRTQAERLLLGDTADAVARRSLIPCLFLPRGARIGGPILAAADGNPRAVGVLRTARDLAGGLGAQLRLVTVDAAGGDAPPLLAESIGAERLAAMTAYAEAALGDTDERGGVATATPLMVRHGDTVEELIAAAEEIGAAVLVVGYHRGGPPGVVEVGSIARRIAHCAPCAVLTVPL